MILRAIGRPAAWVTIVMVLAGPVVGGQQARPAKGTRIAVVAIHDSRLLTLCPVFGKTVVASNVIASYMKAEASVSYPPDGSQSIGLKRGGGLLRVYLPMPGSVISDAAPSTTAPTVRDLERLARDVDVQARVEQQFRALKTYTVVDSPTDADVVFLVESHYVPMASSTTQLPPPRETDRTQSSGDAASRINRIFSDTENEWRRRMWLDKDDPNAPAGPGSAPPWPTAAPNSAARGSSLTLSVVGGDRFATWRQSAIAIAVPAGLYRRYAGDGAALSSARVWQGLSGMHGAQPGEEDNPAQQRARGGTRAVVQSASPEDLVDQFHGKSPRMPADLPVCAATTVRILSVGDRAQRVADIAAAASGARLPPEPTAEPRASTDSGSARFRSNITLVTVPLTVTDSEGRRVADLPLSAFRIFEDGVEQKIDRVEPGSTPSHVALLVDTSQGMRSVIDGMRTAAKGLTEALRPGDEAMVVSFGSRIQVRSDFTTDRDQTGRAIGQLRQRGQTRLYDALTLTVVDRLQHADRRQAIVLFTDGVDTGSQLTDAAGALAAVDTSNVGVYVVRYDTSEAPAPWAKLAVAGQLWKLGVEETQTQAGARGDADRFLERLAVSSGGRLYLARPSADPRELVEQVSQDLSHQYVLRYYPSNATLDGTYRELRVTVDRPGATVRARSGYRAGAMQADPPRSP